MRPVQIVETDPFPRVDDRSTCLRKGIAHSSPQNRKPGLGQFRSMMSLFGEAPISFERKSIASPTLLKRLHLNRTNPQNLLTCHLISQVCAKTKLKPQRNPARQENDLFAVTKRIASDSVRSALLLPINCSITRRCISSKCEWNCDKQQGK